MHCKGDIDAVSNRKSTRRRCIRRRYHAGFFRQHQPPGYAPRRFGGGTPRLPRLHRYPDPYCRRLVQAIAGHEQVPASYILCGNGAADLIYAYCAALRPRTSVELAPTFGEYGAGLAQVGCRVERYFLHQAQNFDLNERFLSFLEEKKPEVVFLCNPNNPTGRLIPLPLLEQILQYCAAQGARLFLDECFLDLTEDGVSAKSLLAAHPELLILKAFTKSYGMAGIRLGYCLCADNALLRRMAATSPPWNVSSLAQSAGVAALAERDFLQRTLSLVRTERRWLTDNLMALGFWVCPSQANYLLFRGPRGLREGLLRRASPSGAVGITADWTTGGIALPCGLTGKMKH